MESMQILSWKTLVNIFVHKCCHLAYNQGQLRGGGYQLNLLLDLVLSNIHQETLPSFFKRDSYMYMHYSWICSFLGSCKSLWGSSIWDSPYSLLWFSGDFDRRGSTVHGIPAVEAGLGTGTVSYWKWSYFKGTKGSFYVSLLQAQFLLKWKLDWK